MAKLSQTFLKSSCVNLFNAEVIQFKLDQDELFLTFRFKKMKKAVKDYLESLLQNEKINGVDLTDDEQFVAVVRNIEKGFYNNQA